MKIRIQLRKTPRVQNRPCLRRISGLFLVVGILALGYVAYSMLDARRYQAAQSRKFSRDLHIYERAIRTDSHPTPLTLPPAAAAGNPAAVDLVRIAHRADSPIGRLEIRSIGLTAMIQEGADARVLRRGLGHLPGTSLPGQKGNVVITGHRDTFFRPLHTIRSDDEITLTTLDGSYRYRVDSTEVVAPTDVRVLADSSDALLTLVTCYPFYFVGPAPKRFIVHAHLLSDPPAATSSFDRTPEPD